MQSFTSQRYSNVLYQSNWWLDPKVPVFCWKITGTFIWSSSSVKFAACCAEVNWYRFNPTQQHRRWIHPSNTNPDIFSCAIVGLLMKVHQPKSKHHPLNDQYDADWEQRFHGTRGSVKQCRLKRRCCSRVEIVLLKSIKQCQSQFACSAVGGGVDTDEGMVGGVVWNDAS
jgi:hypothetical protein